MWQVTCKFSKQTTKLLIINDEKQLVRSLEILSAHAPKISFENAKKWRTPFSKGFPKFVVSIKKICVYCQTKPWLLSKIFIYHFFTLVLKNCHFCCTSAKRCHFLKLQLYCDCRKKFHSVYIPITILVS